MDQLNVNSNNVASLDTIISKNTNIDVYKIWEEESHIGKGTQEERSFLKIESLLPIATISHG
jgi:hypothetical protein